MAIERFYIVKDGERDGPFEPYVRFLLENDEVGFDDFCETEDGERFRLGTMYEPVDESDDEGEEVESEPDADVESASRNRKAKRRRGARPGKVLYVGHPSFLKYPLAWLVVAAGEADFYPRLGPTMEWDTAAGHAVLAAAGGQVLDKTNLAPLKYGKPEYRNPFFLALAPGVNLVSE